MKSIKIAALTLIASGIIAAQDKDANTNREANRPQAAKSAAPVPAGIPKGATQVGTNLYRFVDAQGKAWFYRPSPFGISKWEDKPEVQPVIAQPPTTVRDLGDRVEFERRTPFGVSKWTSKKSDLTAEEKQLLAADQAKRADVAKDADKSADAVNTTSADKNREKQEKE